MLGEKFKTPQVHFGRKLPITELVIVLRSLLTCQDYSREKTDNLKLKRSFLSDPGIQRRSGLFTNAQMKEI